MEKKNVYVLSSLHLPNSLLGLKLAKIVFGDILEVRCSVLEAIATSVGECAYFSDGLTQEIVDDDAELLSAIDEFYHSLSADRKKDFDLDSILERVVLEPNIGTFERNPLKYDHTKMLCSIIKSRLQGCNIVLQATENKNGGGIAQRDGVIYENIRKHGMRENILFIGMEHPLIELMDSKEINAYRVEISQRAGAVFIGGDLPARLKEAYNKVISDCSTPSGYEVKSQVNFV